MPLRSAHLMTPWKDPTKLSWFYPDAFLESYADLLERNAATRTIYRKIHSDGTVAIIERDALGSHTKHVPLFFLKVVLVDMQRGPLWRRLRNLFVLRSLDMSGCSHCSEHGNMMKSVDELKTIDLH